MASWSEYSEQRRPVRWRLVLLVIALPFLFLAALIGAVLYGAGQLLGWWARLAGLEASR